MANCSICGERFGWGIHTCREYITPAKGEAMPQSIEAWEHLYGLAEASMLRQKDEISRLKQRINKLEQS